MADLDVTIFQIGFVSALKNHITHPVFAALLVHGLIVFSSDQYKWAYWEQTNMSVIVWREGRHDIKHQETFMMNNS